MKRYLLCCLLCCALIVLPAFAETELPSLNMPDCTHRFLLGYAQLPEGHEAYHAKCADCGMLADVQFADAQVAPGNADPVTCAHVLRRGNAAIRVAWEPCMQDEQFLHEQRTYYACICDLCGYETVCAIADIGSVAPHVLTGNGQDIHVSGEQEQHLYIENCAVCNRVTVSSMYCRMMNDIVCMAEYRELGGTVFPQ